MLGAYGIVTSSLVRLGLGAYPRVRGHRSGICWSAFVVLEARLRNPIMPLRIFRVPGLAASSVIRGLLITGMFASFFIGVLYLEHIRGFGVLQTGVAFLPQTLVLVALSLGVTARLVIRLGPRIPLIAGLLACAAGLLILGQAGAGTPYFPDVLLSFMLIGVGAGLAFMPLLTIAMAHVPTADAGLASGIINTSLQMSAAIGVAVLGAVVDRSDADAERSGSGPHGGAARRLPPGVRRRDGGRRGGRGGSPVDAARAQAARQRRRYSSAIASSVVTVVQFRAVAVTPSAGPASAAHSLDRPMPSGCQP